VIPTKLCQTHDEVCQHGIGGYMINRVNPQHPFILIFLPHDTVPSALRLYQVNREGGDASWWQLSGPDERPTLSPSIHAPGQWHGYLRDGQLVEC
jgi:hypothetical protein